MSNILNKSSHPVHVNRIPIRIWKLRDEIEKVISTRIRECEKENKELDVSDIRNFYTRSNSSNTNSTDSPSSHLNGDQLDSNGNLMDEDALEMAKALAGDNDSTEAEAKTEDINEAEEPSDDEAQKIAEMMLADQQTSQTIDPPIESSLQNGDQSENSRLGSNSYNLRLLPDEDKIYPGFAFLSDMDMSKILTFSQIGFTLGQNICIEFLIPNSFILTGEVVGSNHVGRNSKIISQMKPDYRIMTSFTFFFNQERENLRNFLKSIEPDIPPPPKKLKKVDEDSEDEFEDLGF